MLFDYIKYLLLGVSPKIHGCLLTSQSYPTSLTQVRLMTRTQRLLHEPVQTFSLHFPASSPSTGSITSPGGPFLHCPESHSKGQMALFWHDKPAALICLLIADGNSRAPPAMDRWIINDFLHLFLAVITESPFTHVIQHFSMLSSSLYVLKWVLGVVL